MAHTTTTVQPSRKRSRVAGFLRPYLCGGSSAIIASCAIHPIDLTKVRLQLIGEGTRSTVRPSAFSVAANVVRTEGVSALYAGLSASITRQATYGTARIGLHTAFSAKLKAMQGGGDLPLYKSFAASFASGAIGSVIGNPCDVALVRMQSDGLKPLAERRGYTGVFNAIFRIAKEEGPRVLWYGFPPTLMRAIASEFCGCGARNRVPRARARHLWRLVLRNSHPSPLCLPHPQ